MTLIENPYETLVSPYFLLRESPSKKPPETVTERHLQVLWSNQSHFLPLFTVKNSPIEVISPGVWNTEAGPDFIKAHLKINGKELRGDIEIHLHDASWQQHQHHLDKRYNRVILHVSLAQPKHPQPLFNQQGKEIERAYFEPFLTIERSKIRYAVDLDVYPYRKFTNKGKCAKGLFSKRSDNEIIAFFKHASDWRLKEKYALLQTFSSRPDLQWLFGMSLALGYKNNSYQFVQLFRLLLSLKVYTADQYLSLAMKCCGFFEKDYHKKWKECPHYRYLLRLAPSKAPLTIQLNLQRIRPFNHPLRRLVLLSKMISDPQIYSLFERMNAFWKKNWECLEHPREYRRFFQQLVDLIPSYQDPYWGFHYTLNCNKQPKELSLIGGDLKKEMIINAYFPLLREQLTQQNSIKELDAFRMLYGLLPASHNSKTGYLNHRFFVEESRGEELVHYADVEQGIFQLHKDFCVHYEASCEGCDLISRINGQSPDEDSNSGTLFLQDEPHYTLCGTAMGVMD